LLFSVVDRGTTLVLLRTGKVTAGSKFVAVTWQISDKPRQKDPMETQTQNTEQSESVYLGNPSWNTTAEMNFWRIVISVHRKHVWILTSMKKNLTCLHGEIHFGS
jgi:hypothetical protein